MSTTPIKATEDLEKIAREAQKVADSAIAAASAPAALRPGEFEAAFSEFSTSKPTTVRAPSTATTPVAAASAPAALSPLETTIKTIARAGARSPLEGEQALASALKSNPELVKQFGAQFGSDGKLKSLGNLDLDGDGKRSRFEDQAIAVTIGNMQANRSYADIAQALDTKGFRERATLELNALIESEFHKKPEKPTTDVAESSCPRVPFRIIPCPKGGQSR